MKEMTVVSGESMFLHRGDRDSIERERVCSGIGGALLKENLDFPPRADLFGRLKVKESVTASDNR